MAGRRALCLLALVAVACQVAVSPGGSPGAPQVALPSPTSARCGQTLTASFVLATDLTCSGDALIAGADGIVIDLGGHSITGPGKGQRNWPNPNLDSVGVKVQQRANVTVRNGTIEAFSTGVLLDHSKNILVTDLTSRLNYYGIYLNQSTASQVDKTHVEKNTYGLHLQMSDGNQITDNDLSRQEYSSPGGYGVYFFQSKNNRMTGNTIAANLNWGIWFSDSRDNVIFHNNVAGNHPEVSDNVGGNTWYDAEKKEGNFWGDYSGIDRDGDGVGDSPYEIGGPGQVVDPYPFVQLDGWAKKRSQTIDHYQPPVAKARRDVRLIALAGGALVGASPSDAAATSLGVGATSIAVSADDRNVYALSGSLLVVMDAVTGAVHAPTFAVDVPGIVAANRDARHAIVLGPAGAEQIDTVQPGREAFAYAHEPREVAPSWKHNILFVSTAAGIDVFYLGKGGNVPYTIPLDGPGGALAMNMSGTRIYAAAQGSGFVDVVDTEQYTIVDRIRLLSDPVAFAVAPDERTLYVATRAGVIAIDLATEAELGSAYFYGTPVDLAMSPNGDELYLGLEGLERGIAVLSTTDLRETNLVRTSAGVSRLLVAAY